MTMVRSGGLRGFEALVRSLGGDPVALLKRHRIPPQALADEEAMIPLRAVAHLYEDAAAELCCPDFALRLSRGWDISILGPLAIAIQHSSTVQEALELASRYLFVHSPAMSVRVLPRSPLDPQLAELRVALSLPGVAVARQVLDACLAGLHLITKALLREHCDVQLVCVPHTPLAPVLSYRRHFGAPVRINEPHAALLLPASQLALPLQSVSPALQQLAADYLDVHYTGPGETVTSRVRHALSRSLGLAPLSRDRVAALLAMHPRTLQRHLGAEGTTFEAVRDEVLRDAAQRYLLTTQMPLSQLAGLLGLSEQSALTRACRRWFGTTPSQLRRRAARSVRAPG